MIIFARNLRDSEMGEKGHKSEDWASINRGNYTKSQ